MGRQIENNLKWFPLVVGFFSDRRIKRLGAQFGSDGPLFYLYILCAAYGGDGYYVKADADFLEDAAMDIGCSPDKIGLMLRYLLNKSLLDSTRFDTVKVLTSHGIQAQYQQSMKGLRRDVEVDGSVWVLDEEETLGLVKVRPYKNKSGKNADKSGINHDKSGIYDTNKIKENKRKENKREGAFAPPTLKEIEAYAKERGNRVDAKRFYDYFNAGGWVDSKGNPVRNWKQKLITWENHDPQPKKEETQVQRAAPNAEELEKLRKLQERIRGQNDA